MRIVIKSDPLFKVFHEDGEDDGDEVFRSKDKYTCWKWIQQHRKTYAHPLILHDMTCTEYSDGAVSFG
jgi:hypothetical protein